MTWRIVEITNNCKLELKMNFLVVRGETIKKIHLSEIAMLIIESTMVSLTAALLCELSKKKIKVIFCDEKRNPYGEIVSYYGAHDSANKLKVQISWDKTITELIWAEIVRDKINKQMGVLIRAGLLEQSSYLRCYADEVESDDISNREGHAAKVYFNALFGKCFSRRDENITNSCLNYGYSIMLSAFNREIICNGYNTQIGIFHDNKFNQYNLASDLMEPFRPIVDEYVLNANPKQFGVEEKRALVDLLNIQVKIEGKSNFLLNAIKIYCRSFFEAVSTNSPKELKTYEVQIHEGDGVL